MGAARAMTRSGGRTEENRRAVVKAVLDLLREGRLLFDAPEVAERSGVHRTTIRRRWPSRDALITEAMAEHTSRLDADLSGDWRGVVRSIAFALRDFNMDPTEAALNRMLALTDSAEVIGAVARQWGVLFETFAAPLLAAQRRGHIRADADVQMIVLSLASSLLTITVYNRLRPSDAATERLVAQAIRGMEPQGAAVG